MQDHCGSAHLLKAPAQTIAWLEQEVLTAFSGRVLAFDLEASRIYAQLMAHARAKGLAIGGEDGYIAATATANGFTIATRDTSPFEAAGLSVINPWLKG